MTIKILLLMLNVLILNALPSEYKTEFDERQVGTVNVRLNIKDFAIILGGIDEDLPDLSDDTLYDDDYDYSVDQLTINPATGLFTDNLSTHRPPSTKPTTTSTHRPNSIQDIINNTNKPMRPLHYDDDKPLITPPATQPPSSTISPVTSSTSTQPPSIVVNENLETPVAPQEHMNDRVPNSQSMQSHQIPVQVLIEPQSLPPLNKQHPKSHYILNRFAQKPSVEILGENVMVEDDQDQVKEKCENDEVLDNDSGLCKKRFIGLGGHHGHGGGPLKGIRKILHNFLNKHHII